MSGKWLNVANMSDSELQAASAMLHRQIVERQKFLMKSAEDVGKIVADERARLVVFYEEMSQRTGTNWINPTSAEGLADGAQASMEASEKKWQRRIRLTNSGMRLLRFFRRIKQNWLR